MSKILIDTSEKLKHVAIWIDSNDNIDTKELLNVVLYESQKTLSNNYTIGKTFMICYLSLISVVLAFTTISLLSLVYMLGVGYLVFPIKSTIARLKQD